MPEIGWTETQYFIVPEIWYLLPLNIKNIASCKVFNEKIKQWIRVNRNECRIMN